MHSLRGKDAALQAVCAQSTFPPPFQLKMKIRAEISLCHFSEHKSLSYSIYQNCSQLSSPVKVLHKQKNAVTNLYSFRETEYHGHRVGLHGCAHCRHRSTWHHLTPPILVTPGTSLPLNLEFEMLYKPIDFMFSSASPLAGFLCLLTKPSCLHLN